MIDRPRPAAEDIPATREEIAALFDRVLERIRPESPERSRATVLWKRSKRKSEVSKPDEAVDSTSLQHRYDDADERYREGLAGLHLAIEKRRAMKNMSHDWARNRRRSRPSKGRDRGGSG